MLTANIGLKLKPHRSLVRSPEAYIEALKWYLGINEYDAFKKYLSLVQEQRYRYIEKIVNSYILYHGF